MKKSTGPSSAPSKLNKSVDRHLHAYATAAAAAGVGILALSQPANAEVVHKVVNVTIGPFSPYTLELNKIGVGDFTITSTVTEFSSGGHQEGVVVLPIGSKNEVWVANLNNARAIGNDVTIGPGGTFQHDSTFNMVIYYNNGNVGGSWQDVKGKFLGFKYADLAGRAHYGWARLNVVDGVTFLIDYEYDNTENTPVTTCKGSSSGSVVESGAENLQGKDAAETSKSPSLGHLAAGAAAIGDWRIDSATK